MQLSSANLLIAAQQTPKVGAAPRADQAPFTSALAKEQDGFEALPFQQAAPPSSAPARPSAVPKPLGSTVDIRV